MIPKESVCGYQCSIMIILQKHNPFKNNQLNISYS